MQTSIVKYFYCEILPGFIYKKNIVKTERDFLYIPNLLDFNVIILLGRATVWSSSLGLT